MDCIEELKKQYEELGRSGYFFFVPEQLTYNLMDVLLEDESICLLKPISFKKSYLELFDN